jgi:glycosyltransferase involved in cell wall biosynthesis
MTDNIVKIEKTISSLKNGTNKFYFFVQDTKGNPKASIKYIYDLANALKQNGKNSIILFEEKGFTSHKTWLGEGYEDLEENYVNGQNLQVGVEDFLIIPELLGYIIEQVQNLPCGKIIITQAYDHIFETLKPGQSWNGFGVYKCLTTSEVLAEKVRDIFRSVSVDVLPVPLSKYATEKDKPAKPIIAIHSREQRDSLNLIKTFYQKYPQYRWFTFRDMRSINQDQFYEPLKDACVSVWIDEKSSFGTYPLESMASGTPVIGRIPYIEPEWINEKNGIWTTNNFDLVDILAEYIKNWLEDNVAETLIQEGLDTAKKYQNQDDFVSLSNQLFEEYVSNRVQSLEQQLDKLKPVEAEL